MTQSLSNDARLVASYVRYAESLDADSSRAKDAGNEDKVAYQTIQDVIVAGPAPRS